MTHADERVLAGMRDQLAGRDRSVHAGARQIGWKLGFGAPAALARFRLDRPLVGHLLDRGVLSDEARVPVGDWTRPVLEPEVAVHLARDVGGDASWDEVRGAVAGLSAAIELADADPPPVDVREILAGNIFHRHVVLGPVDASRSTAEGLSARVLRDGAEVARTDDPTGLTGELIEVVRLTAELLDACGERLDAEQVVIAGSVVPPLSVAAGQRITVELAPLGALSVSLVD